MQLRPAQIEVGASQRIEGGLERDGRPLHAAVVELCVGELTEELPRHRLADVVGELCRHLQFLHRSGQVLPLEGRGGSCCVGHRSELAVETVGLGRCGPHAHDEGDQLHVRPKLGMPVMVELGSQAGEGVWARVEHEPVGPTDEVGTAELVAAAVEVTVQCMLVEPEGGRERCRALALHQLGSYLVVAGALPDQQVAGGHGKDTQRLRSRDRARRRSVVPGGVNH